EGATLKEDTMTSEQPTPDTPQFQRRELMQAAGAAVVAATAGAIASGSAAAEGSNVIAEEHWAKKGPVDLYIYRKRQQGGGGAPRPVLFLVHGSSFSPPPTYY